MTWLAVIFFCLAEDDCKFWFKETARPIECEQTLAKAMRVMEQANVPVFYGTCLATKGKDA
jgi:hypothetical protein